MFRNQSLFLALVITIALTGCADKRVDVAWPEARPLGRDIKTYRPPLKSSKVDSESSKTEKPTGVITLRQTLALALMRNPELAAFSWEVRAGEARVLQAGLLPNPEFEVEVEEFGGRDERNGFDTTETTLQLSQLILLGGKISKRSRVATLERDLAGWDYEIKRLNVLTETTKSFVGVLTAQEQLALAEEMVRLSNQVFDTVSKRVRAGKVSPLQETKAGVVLSTSKIQREQARRNLKVARNRLAATWNSTSPAFERAKGRLDILKPIPPADQLTDLISQNPDIARWATAIEQRRAAVELERARVIPDLTVSGGIRRFEETDDNAFVMGLSIPIPLFDRNQGGVLEAHYKQLQAERERRAAEVRIKSLLVRSYQMLYSSYIEATALKNDVLPAAQRAFDAASEGYKYGKFGYLDVLDAQRTLFEAKEHSVESLSAYHQAVADVERLIGTGLDNIGKNMKNKEE